MSAEKIAEVLAQHRSWRYVGWAADRRWLCSCGVLLDDDPSGRDIVARHERHVAEALAPLLAAEREAGRVEGMEGAAELVGSLRVHTDYNPYSTCPDGCGWFNYAAMKIRDRAALDGTP